MSGVPRRSRRQGGSPAWMTTFADLMAVLVVFFVMLFAFSTLDAERYQQLADSLREVLGSTVVEETSPDIPEPTIMDLEGRAPEPRPIEKREEPQRDPAFGTRDEASRALRTELAPELENGLVEIEDRDEGVLLRFEERAAFELGEKELEPDFIPVLRRVGEVLTETPGMIDVSGHTDDLPIRSERFRSNWDLSAARAVSVLHVFEDIGVPAGRMRAIGRADTRPLVPNQDAASRAGNRRVEVYLAFDGTDDVGETRSGTTAPGTPQ